MLEHQADRASRDDCEAPGCRTDTDPRGLHSRMPPLMGRGLVLRLCVRPAVLENRRRDFLPFIALRLITTSLSLDELHRG